MSRFTRNLELLMAERGIRTRADLARACGLSQGTVHGWFQNCVEEVSEASLRRLCAGLGCTVGDLKGRAPGGRGPVEGSLRERVVGAVALGVPPATVAQRFGVTQKAVERWAAQEAASPRPVTPAPKDAVPVWLRPWLRLPTHRSDRCLVCGSAEALEQHHPLPRSQGGSRGPTLTLCRRCHDAIHMRRVLHLRPVAIGMTFGVGGSGGHAEWLETEEPMGDFEALGLRGWHRLGSWRKGVRPSWARKGDEDGS